MKKEIKAMISEITGYKYKCPYCGYSAIFGSYEQADLELKLHIAVCGNNPLNKMCQSCIHRKTRFCMKYDEGCLFAMFRYPDQNYNCTGYETKPRYAKIYEKLRAKK